MTGGAFSNGQCDWIRCSRCCVLSPTVSGTRVASVHSIGHASLLVICQFHRRPQNTFLHFDNSEHDSLNQNKSYCEKADFVSFELGLFKMVQGGSGFFYLKRLLLF